RLRVREPKGLCDPDVRQVSGYLDTDEGHHFFFWTFESRNDPKNDPVILWINGGPGCSSFTGLLQELGPCLAQPKGRDPLYNPHSWNSNASVIFLDQPVDVGFSWSDDGDKGVYTTEAAARDFYAFVQILFEAYRDTLGASDFHIAGESYAGRYIPLFADHIIKQNEQAKLRGGSEIRLASTMIGNGFTDPLLQYASYAPVACTNETGYGPLISKRECTKLRAAVPRCEALVKACYGNERNSALCIAAYVYCEAKLTSAYAATGLSMYDMTKKGDYKEGKWIEAWLNKPEVRHELGVDLDKHGHGTKKFVGCSDKVFRHFEQSGDQAKPSFHQVANALESGVDTLIYVGTKDFICNFHGNQAWTLALPWSGHDHFSHEPLRPWYASEEAAKARNATRAGEYRQYGRLAFAGVDGAGHFVPYDKPEEALALVNRWI
ncbi:carboxypeptidase Y, partial [Rhodotorula sp. JG-1b]